MRIIKIDCAELEKCLRYLEMTLDPESEVLRCGDCPAYKKTVKISTARMSRVMVV